MSEATEFDIIEQIGQDLEQVEVSLAASFETGAEDFNALIRPLSAAGGKRLRAQLCILVALAGNSVQEERIKIAESVEMLHLATLIHDDVLDQAAIRRGESTIHTHKGNKIAILSGDYLFAKCFALVASLNSTEYLKVFTHIITCLVEGEFMQMEDVYRIDQGIDRYMTKTQKKTADFMEGCMELGGMLGGWSPEHIVQLKRYGHALGMAFQITDDIMDYRESSDTTGKPSGNDLKEGLLTYPLLSIVTDDNKDKLLADIKNLANGGDDQAIIDYVIAQGGVDNTLVVADKYCNDAYDALNQLPDFDGKVLLEMAVANLADRKV
ncbi:MAG: polyprenyl synthetase family protein [Veillonella sp.]|uniref:polyprenyl synthetase family protein n=1 Tax=Veillonella sp. TaxID=1926307 RepID=UPI001B44821E|nr:polyprenyl synthetase family protein [Veillonella sp.]MBP6922733.1 polyprenyl synthetase family protein [Veillonella sp.]MBP9516867.1 polyprenyl synthetase family protein [Veillonella sp.]MBP9551193.1 polyprenyl synthetase family protein [Veillonella sp.]